jgi:pyrophosphatase PpaX
MNIHEQMRTLDARHADELVRVYRQHNEPLHADLQGFPGVENLLGELQAQGRKLGVVTSKRRRTVDLAFAVLPIERFFDAVVTSGDTERHKPNPEPVLLALERLGADPADAAFVGDSPFDVRSGKAAGVLSVGVSWGGLHSDERLVEAGAHVVVHRPEDLLDVL